MANTLITKNSSTAAAIPTAGQLVQGELAVNVTDKRIFTENSGGTVVELGTNPSALNFADNAKAIFGAGSDLQIYHDGTNSYITDAGTGKLLLRSDGTGIDLQTSQGETMLRALKDSYVQLYYDNALKLATTATGVDVTGEIVADGLTLANGAAVDFTAATVSSESYLNVNIDSNNNQTGQTFNITHDDGSKYLFTASESGDVSFYEDTGTTPKFVWKASDERLGIGTDSPTAPLSIGSSGATGRAADIKGSSVLFNSTDTFDLIMGDGGVAYMSLSTTNSGTALKVRDYSGNSDIATFERTTGRVGIGTSSPSSKLEVQTGTTSAALWAQTGGTTSGYTITDFRTGTNASAFATFGDTSSVWQGGGMTLTAAGNLLVNTTDSAPANNNVGGFAVGAGASGATLQVSANGSSNFNRTASNGTLVVFSRAGTEVGTIHVTTSATSYNTSSDYRLKEDWVAVADASTRVNSLKPINFAWKVDGSRVDGFLAHELAEVVPEAVTGVKDAVDADGNPEYQGIDQSKLVPLLTAALQEALAKIESLEARLDAANI